MALINCPECGNPVSSKATACPHCGCPTTSQDVSDKASLTITMATQRFLVSATVNINLDGQDIGVIGDGQSITVQVTHGHHTMVLSSSFRKRELSLNVDGDIRVDAKWNRITGGIDAQAFPA